MMPSAKIANWVSAPPENRLISVKAPLGSLDAGFCRKSWTASKSTPGTGRWEPSRYTAMIATVNRILPRSSGILKALRKADSIRGFPLLCGLDDLYGTAGGRELGGRGGREGVGPHLQGHRDLPVAEHLDRGALAGQAGRDQPVRVDAAAARERRLEPVQVDHRPADLVGVGEPAQLGDPALERHLAALEADPDLPPGLGPLGAPAGRLALARGIAAALADPVLGRPGRRAQVMQLHSSTSSTSTRWETLKIMPRISGRSSLTTLSPIRLSPRLLTVARWGRGRPIRDRFWVTLRRVVTPTAPSPCRRRRRPRPPPSAWPPSPATSRPARGRAGRPPPGAAEAASGRPRWHA